MESTTDSERIRQLRLAAKWSADNDEQKRAISSLVQYGEIAVPVINEVLAVSAFEDVKQACVDAISSIGREQRSEWSIRPPPTTKNARKTTKRKNQKKKKGVKR